MFAHDKHRAEWRDSRPKFRNPVKKKKKSWEQEILGQKNSLFSESYCFYETKLPFPKNWWFSCNAGQFLSVHGNLLLQTRSDSSPILPGMECSLIWKLRIWSQNVTHFASFRRHNSVFKQKGHGFQNYYLQKKFIGD